MAVSRRGRKQDWSFQKTPHCWARTSEGGVGERGLGRRGECTANTGHLAGCERSQHRPCLLLSEQTCSPSPEMLLKMKNLKPLRVYGEAIETMEFPYPGSNRNIYRRALRDTTPKRELR